MKVAVNKMGEKGLGSRGQERGGTAWRSQSIQRYPGAPLRREGARERVVVEVPAAGRGKMRV